MFTNFKIDPSELSAMVATMRASFANSGKPGTFEDNAVRVIANRMREHPAQYLEFGPYWWAVKEVLRGADPRIGDRGDPVVQFAPYVPQH